VHARIHCQPVLLAMLDKLEPHHLPRLLQVMEGLRMPLPVGELSALLNHEDVEILIAALRIASDPLLRSFVLNLTRHANWRVRMQAARTLGRIGQPNDIVHLIDLLSDREWWVRYRSAQALASLPFLDRTQLTALANAAADRFAGDMLRQVLAETRSA
jgi:HEAT repeat protein